MISIARSKLLIKNHLTRSGGLLCFSKVEFAEANSVPYGNAESFSKRIKNFEGDNHTSFFSVSVKSSFNGPSASFSVYLHLGKFEHP